jgi:glutathione S-transferase
MSAPSIVIAAAKPPAHSVTLFGDLSITRFRDALDGNGRRVELYQAEWCPHSHKVRQRLTELGLSFTARQVAADPAEREELKQRAGTNEIPVLITDDGDAVCGEDDILGHLKAFDERPDADAHRRKSREEVGEFAA